MELRRFALALILTIAPLAAFADDGPPVTVLLRSQGGVEGDGGYSGHTLVVQLEAPAPATVKLTIATVAGGTALPGVDYLPLSEVLTFAPGETLEFTSVRVYGDLSDEEHETFIVTAKQDGVIRATVTAEIYDDDDLPGARIADAVTVPEYADFMWFTVTLTEPSKIGASFDYTVEGGAAVEGEDYELPYDKIIVAPGSRQGSLLVLVVDDDIYEFPELLTVRLSNPVNAFLIDSTAIGQINDDDVPKPGYTIAEASGPEGHTGASEVELRITLMTPSTSPITATVAATGAGTGLAGTDYEVVPQSITFPPGITEATAHVTILGDTIEETHENFEVGVFEDGVLRGAGLVTIADDDDGTVPPVVSVGDVTITESDTSSDVSFLLTLSRPATGVTRVSYRTSDRTASAPGDYEHVSGQVEFPYGQTSRAVTVRIAGDRIHEDTETLALELFGGIGVTIGDGSALCTIADDDPPKRRAARH